MNYELTKAEKKIARQLIDKGLDTAYLKALEASAAVIKKWQDKKLDNKEGYLTLYKTLDKHDGGIARQYNGLTGSGWLATVADLFAEGVISEEEIQGFSEDKRNIIYAVGNWRKE